MARILIIDDSASALELTRSILAEAGHSVLACACAKSASRVMAQTAVELIVTDLYMPDKDGMEVISDARRVCPQVPIIAMSGAAGIKNLLQTARVLGAACTLQKPFSSEQLLQAVSSALGVGCGPRDAAKDVTLA